MRWKTEKVIRTIPSENWTSWYLEDGNSPVSELSLIIQNGWVPKVHIRFVSVFICEKVASKVFLFAAAYFVLCGCGKANYEENDIVFSSDKEVYWVVLQPRKQCLLCLYKWQVLTVVVHVGLQRARDDFDEKRPTKIIMLFGKKIPRQNIRPRLFEEWITPSIG